MPISQYDRYFSGKPGSAQKALTAMQHTYGQKKGTTVFYATLNRNKAGLRQGGRGRLKKALRKRMAGGKAR